MEGYYEPDGDALRGREKAGDNADGSKHYIEVPGAMRKDEQE